MKALAAETGDVILINEDTPIAIIKSRELSDDMREMLSHGIIYPVCEMILKMRKLHVEELETIFNTNKEFMP